MQATAQPVSTPVEDDTKLVDAARGDGAAFARLYDRYYPRIFNYVMRTLMNVEAAEDVTSETFLKALRSLHRFKGTKGSFSAWLYRIASNAMMDHFRRNARNPVAVEDEYLQNGRLFKNAAAYLKHPDEQAQELEEYRNLHRAIRKIQPKYQQALILFYFEEKSHKEIARILNCSAVLSKWRLHQARKVLAAQLANEPPTEMNAGKNKDEDKSN